jgi:hypothetical protein
VIHGWRKALALEPVALMSWFERFCAGFLCRDVDREGTMRGTNLGWFRKLREATALPIVAAGEFPRDGKSAHSKGWGSTPPSEWRSTRTACADFACLQAQSLFATRLLQYDTGPCAPSCGLSLFLFLVSLTAFVRNCRAPNAFRPAQRNEALCSSLSAPAAQKIMPPF